MRRRCPYCHAPVSFGAIIKYRLWRDAEQLRCERCASEISYVFAPGLMWPATGLGLGLIASKVVLSLTDGNLVASLVVFGCVMALAAIGLYYTTPLKSG